MERRCGSPGGSVGQADEPCPWICGCTGLTNSDRVVPCWDYLKHLQRYPVGMVLTQDGILDDAENQPMKALQVDQNAAAFDLVPGQRLDLGEGASVQMIASSSRGTAVLVEWKRLRILVPDGVSLDAIRCAASQKLRQLSGLIFDPGGSARNGTWGLGYVKPSRAAGRQLAGRGGSSLQCPPLPGQGLD